MRRCEPRMHGSPERGWRLPPPFFSGIDSDTRPHSPSSPRTTEKQSAREERLPHDGIGDEVQHVSGVAPKVRMPDARAQSHQELRTCNDLIRRFARLPAGRASAAERSRSRGLPVLSRQGSLLARARRRCRAEAMTWNVRARHRQVGPTVLNRMDPPTRR